MQVESTIALCVVSHLLTGHEANVHIGDMTRAAQDAHLCLHLRPLNELQRLRYAAQVVSDLAMRRISHVALPPKLVQVLEDRAAGNPQHIEEMLVALMGKDGAPPAIRVTDNGGVQVRQ